MSTEPNRDPSPATDPILGVPGESADPDLVTSSPMEPADDDQQAPPVARQRAELADTVDALHDRFDVRERARAEASARTDQVKQTVGENQNVIIGVLGALGLAAVVATVARLRRKSRERGAAGCR